MIRRFGFELTTKRSPSSPPAASRPPANMVLPETPSHTPLAHDEEIDILDSLNLDPKLTAKLGTIPPSRVPVTVRPGESLLDKIPDSVRQGLGKGGESNEEEEGEYEMGDVFKSVVQVSQHGGDDEEGRASELTVGPRLLRHC